MRLARAGKAVLGFLSYTFAQWMWMLVARLRTYKNLTAALPTTPFSLQKKVLQFFDLIDMEFFDLIDTEFLISQILSF